jgi:hypothetical protein
VRRGSARVVRRWAVPGRAPGGCEVLFEGQWRPANAPSCCGSRRPQLLDTVSPAANRAGPRRAERPNSVPGQLSRMREVAAITVAPLAATPPNQIPVIGRQLDPDVTSGCRAVAPVPPMGQSAHTYKRTTGAVRSPWRNDPDQQMKASDRQGFRPRRLGLALTCASGTSNRTPRIHDNPGVHDQARARCCRKSSGPTATTTAPSRALTVRRSPIFPSLYLRSARPSRKGRRPNDDHPLATAHPVLPPSARYRTHREFGRRVSQTTVA